MDGPPFTNTRILLLDGGLFDPTSMDEEEGTDQEYRGRTKPTW